MAAKIILKFSVLVNCCVVIVGWRGVVWRIFVLQLLCCFFILGLTLAAMLKLGVFY